MAYSHGMKTISISQLLRSNDKADRGAINKLFEGVPPYTESQMHQLGPISPEDELGALAPRVTISPEDEFARFIVEKHSAAQNLMHRCSDVRKNIKGLHVTFYDEDGRVLKC